MSKNKVCKYLREHAEMGFNFILCGKNAKFHHFETKIFKFDQVIFIIFVLRGHKSQLIFVK